MLGVSLFTDWLWVSVSMSWAPPTESVARTAVASTRMPSPPSHWSTLRHISTDREWISKSTSTVAPVVVMPLMLSKRALTGWAMVPWPATRKGMAPTSAMASQTSVTIRNASRLPSSRCSRLNSRPAPTTTVTATATRNGVRGSP